MFDKSIRLNSHNDVKRSGLYWLSIEPAEYFGFFKKAHRNFKKLQETSCNGLQHIFY